MRAWEFEFKVGGLGGGCLFDVGGCYVWLMLCTSMYIYVRLFIQVYAGTKPMFITIKSAPSCLLTPHLLRLPLPPPRRREIPLNTLSPTKIKPRAKENHHEIEHTERPEYPIIQPSIAVINIKSRRKLIPIRILAELAQAIAAVLDVAADLLGEGCGVGFAGQARWGGEAGEFGGGAAHGAVVGGDAEKAVEEVAEGGQVVHP